jgi:hypothetical protein
MLNTLLAVEDRITTAHRGRAGLGRCAAIIAGSGPASSRKYRVAVSLCRAGRPAWLDSRRVQVIDDDLGKSGTSSYELYGFQRLIAEVGLSKAGLVISLDASRLARNNRDWLQLLKLCSLFGVLIADGKPLHRTCCRRLRPVAAHWHSPGLHPVTRHALA